MGWEDAQRWEREWHGNAANSLGEEIKQIAYAKRMGLEFYNDGKTPYNIRCHGRSIVDIGGGPYSLLLKAHNATRKVVVEPMEMPLWVYERYRAAGVEVVSAKGEDIRLEGFDEAWIYNVLQHVEEPERIVANARRAARTVRIFEWIDTPPNIGHPQTLTREKLDAWLGGSGETEHLYDTERNLRGPCYFGVFP